MLLQAILSEIIAMGAGDFIGRDFIQRAVLDGIEDRAGRILDHHGSIDSRDRILTDCKNTVILQQDYRSRPERSDDFLANLIPTDRSISADGDPFSEFNSEGCQDRKNGLDGCGDISTVQQWF